MTQPIYNVEGKKHWSPDPNITPEQLEEMRVKVLDDIIVARVGLLLRHPFFGNMATRLRVLAADDWCPTAAVDGRNLYYNTQFFAAMDNFETELVVMGIKVAITQYQLPIDPDEVECFDEFHERFGKYIQAANS